MRAVRRPPLTVLAAAVVLLAGLVGVVRSAQPQSTANTASVGSGGGASSMAGMDGMSPDMAIMVRGAYLRQPANRINAAAYLTIFNTTATADTLVSVASGAGALTTVHTEGAGGGMQQAAGGLPVPAHGSLSLTPGKGHVMIELLFGPLLAGQTVNIELTFARAGVVIVTARVIGVTAPVPTPNRTA
ncbi:MAG TPA: copper chaperone PCu(A)C [Jatrophihabitans sp.]|nr:copper chaperone PCu(A)C [Jatrophihabitans sp.]